MAAAIGGAVIAMPAHADLPAVARARYGAEQGLAKGTVFFLATAAGPVAVGAAHSFDIAKLAASPELVFELGRSRAPVASSTRLLTLPGVGFGEPGGTLRSDLVVFALDAPPTAVSVLQPGQATQRMEIAVLGVPGSVPKDQDAVAGEVREIDEEKLEVELDTAYDLRGWGGAPIVSREDGRVVGIVQAAQPTGRTMRVIATPIVAVLDALRFPLEGGRGRGFATLQKKGPNAASEVKPIPAPAEATAQPQAKTSAPPPVRQTVPQRPAAVSIEVPQNGATFGGVEPIAFVAGRALVPRSEGLTTDVVFVMDVSGSTTAPSGADVNGNGVIGAPPNSAADGLFALGSADPGDSILAAEIAAVRRLLSRLDRRYTRVALATFSGQMLDYGVLAENPAVTEMALTANYEDLQRALDRVFARGASGGTFMAAGVDQATNEMLGKRGAFSSADAKSQRVIVFLTDGIPTLPFEGDDPRNTITVMRAAERARARRTRGSSASASVRRRSRDRSRSSNSRASPAAPSHRCAIQRCCRRSSATSSSPRSTSSASATRHSEAPRSQPKSAPMAASVPSCRCAPDATRSKSPHARRTVAARPSASRFILRPTPPSPSYLRVSFRSRRSCSNCD